ncbi:hypothetical protein TWF481_001889 [Arthrobotrys musiformis]|uniref:Uncharacterized protein n=1 Tax=Arthrobotrys musiformis TaxID=47236 RepID=A0AAV9VW62_9PEZI
MNEDDKKIDVINCSPNCKITRSLISFGNHIDDAGHGGAALSQKITPCGEEFFPAKTAPGVIHQSNRLIKARLTLPSAEKCTPVLESRNRFPVVRAWGTGSSASAGLGKTRC